MAVTDINSEDRLVQQTFAEHLRDALGWDSVFAWNEETFGPESTLGRADTREMVLTRDLRHAIERLNPNLPEKAVEEAVEKLTRQDFSRSMLQHKQEFHRYIRIDTMNRSSWRCSSGGLVDDGSAATSTWRQRAVVS